VPSRSALADRSDLPVLLIRRVSKADKNKIGEVDRRRFAEVSDLRESKWDTEISWEIPRRYQKVFSKNKNNFRKESFSENSIDNQSSVLVTQVRYSFRKDPKWSMFVGERYQRLQCNAKVVGSTICDVLVRWEKLACVAPGLVFWTKHDICITSKNIVFTKDLLWVSACFHWKSIRRPAG